MTTDEELRAVCEIAFSEVRFWDLMGRAARREAMRNLMRYVDELEENGDDDDC